METQSINILLADDDNPFRAWMEQRLQRARFDVISCSNGQDAIELISNVPFDVVVLDYKMPEQTGLNVLQWMHEQKLDIPVILLTGNGSENIAIESIKFGAYNYLQKGTNDMDRLEDELRAAHGEHMLNREKAAAADKQFPSTREKQLADMLDSVSSVVKNSLATLQLRLDESENEVTTLNSDQKNQLKAVLEELRSEQQVLSSSINALLSVTKALEVAKLGSFFATQTEEFKKKFSTKI
jgi:DNA-binding response OmpR family regulator